MCSVRATALTEHIQVLTQYKNTAEIGGSVEKYRGCLRCGGGTTASLRRFRRKSPRDALSRGGWTLMFTLSSQTLICSLDHIFIAMVIYFCAEEQKISR